MEKYLVFIPIILVFSLALALADKPDLLPAEVNPSHNNVNVVIPENAIEVAPGVFSLGVSSDNGELVEGYAIVRYKEANSHRELHSHTSGTNNCYGFLASGAKWKVIEPYVVNPSNTEGMSETFVVNNLASDISAWESAAGKNILGTGSSTTDVLVADTSSPDGKNEVYFGSISSSGAIAVTIVWGVFSGPTSNRKLVEWDQVYDQVDFNWTADALIEPTKMDFWNIAIHELGHSCGMKDLYTLSCSEETMYGYGKEGEIKKRDLGPGDIVGIRKLYA